MFFIPVSAAEHLLTYPVEVLNALFMKVIPCSASILGTRTHMPSLLANNRALYEERNVFNKSIRPQGHKVSCNENRKVNNSVSKKYRNKQEVLYRVALGFKFLLKFHMSDFLCNIFTQLISLFFQGKPYTMLTLLFLSHTLTRWPYEVKYNSLSRDILCI